MQEGEVIQLCHLMNHSLICKPYTGGRHRAGWWIEGHTGVCVWVWVYVGVGVCVCGCGMRGVWRWCVLQVGLMLLVATT